MAMISGLFSNTAALPAPPHCKIPFSFLRGMLLMKLFDTFVSLLMLWKTAAIFYIHNCVLEHRPNYSSSGIIHRGSSSR